MPAVFLKPSCRPHKVKQLHEGRLKTGHASLSPELLGVARDREELTGLPRIVSQNALRRTPKKRMKRLFTWTGASEKQYRHSADHNWLQQPFTSREVCLSDLRRQI